jgi:hypothetical protein
MSQMTVFSGRERRRRWSDEERTRILAEAFLPGACVAAVAINYMLKRWSALTLFLDDGRVCLSNNAAERALRGIALGRRSWLFCGSDRGGQRAAAVYSLIDVARREQHRGRRLNMQRNKVYAVTVIAAVAKQLGVDEDLLHEMSVGLEPEDGVIWVYGINEDAIKAFTEDGIEELKNLLEMYRQDPDLFT